MFLFGFAQLCTNTTHDGLASSSMQFIWSYSVWVGGLFLQSGFPFIAFPIFPFQEKLYYDDVNFQNSCEYSCPKEAFTDRISKKTIFNAE